MTSILGQSEYYSSMPGRREIYLTNGSSQPLYVCTKYNMRQLSSVYMSTVGHLCLLSHTTLHIYEPAGTVR
jgi:hypothetical protein